MHRVLYESSLSASLPKPDMEWIVQNIYIEKLSSKTLQETKT